MTKFKVGDQVKVVGYGHCVITGINESGTDAKIIDLSPEAVGQIGIISQAREVQRIDQYAIEGIKGKHAWYQNGQLELVYRPKYNVL